MTEQKEPTTAEKLTNAITATKGLVGMKWADEVWESSGLSLRVLQLSIKASSAFQIRALEEAMRASKNPSHSPIALETAEFFHIHKPTAHKPIGHLSIRVGDALDPILSPHIERAILALKIGQEGANNFKIKDIENAARSAFGDHIKNCSKNGRRRPENVTLTVSCANIEAFKTCGQAILENVLQKLRCTIPDNRADAMALQAKIISPREEIVISFNPAYAREFLEACTSLKGKLNPKTIKEQLTL